ncbi:MAG: hypothetical protein P1V97_03690 [Planctomycetota bacterium]|nr:hypothetical protein [Planctomycetota bacterium]
MALFQSSKDLFELIPRPESISGSRFQKEDELFSIEGKTVVIVDEWSTDEVVGTKVTPEVTLRKDTLIVITVVASVLVCLAFLFGRATARDGTAAAENTEQTKQELPKNVFDPKQNQGEAIPRLTPNYAVDRGQGQQQAAPETPAVPERQAAQGKYECQVVTTTSDKAAAVVKYLNESPQSPIAGRNDLKGYVRGRRAVRIKGFVEKDQAILKRIHKMKDPTGGGHFKGALFLKSSR